MAEMENMKYRHELEFVVRDYECDLQGVVNNANFLHYMEHARHQWMESRGIDFAALHGQGIDLVVARIEIDYKHPLRSRDRLIVRSAVRREGALRIICAQDIYRIPDEKLIAQSQVVVVMLQNGKPVPPTALVEKMEQVPQ
jgi:acyl-CoA thioester hydrolase